MTHACVMWLAQTLCCCRKVYEPESEQEVVQLIRRAIGEGWQLRVLGSGISPNALGFSDKCMISMAQMDKVINVDVNTKQVRQLLSCVSPTCHQCLLSLSLIHI